MKEIKAVMDRLKKEYDNLEKANAEATQTINEKQNEINTLTDEINALQAEIEIRKENMARLEQKIAETEAFERSIDEVAPLITETEEKKEVEPEHTGSVLEESEEPEHTGSVLEESEEPKMEEPAPFTFRNNLDVFGDHAEESEVTETTTEVPAEEKPVEEVPAMTFMGNAALDNASFTPNFGVNEGYSNDFNVPVEEAPVNNENSFVPGGEPEVNAMSRISDIYNPLDSQEIETPIIR